MEDRKILFLCSKCEARFELYKQCVDHVCGVTLINIPSLEEFSKMFSVVNEAYRNYRYILFVREKLLSLFPNATCLEDIKKLSLNKGSRESTAWKILRKAEINFSKGSRPQIIKFPELGPLTLKNVLYLRKRKEFTSSHLTLLYNTPPTFPEHFTMLWAKADFRFWPFFFTKDFIYSNMFSKQIVMIDLESCFVFTSKQIWEKFSLEEFLNIICLKIIGPLLEDMCFFVCDCFRNKKFCINNDWKDIDAETRAIKLQLQDICGGDWFDFFSNLPHAFDHLNRRVNDYMCLDSLLKREIENFSRSWLPFLNIFCSGDIILEKYGYLL